MPITCSKCGGAGHNARSCKAAGTRDTPTKPARTLATLEPIAAQLEARAAKIRQELETIERILRDLDTLGGAS